MASLAHNNKQPTGPADHRVSRAVPLAFVVFGIIIGTISVAGAAMMLHTDQLITPRGWIVVCGTTTCALAVFLGINGYQHAATRESFGELKSAIHASNQKIDNLTRSRRHGRRHRRKPPASLGPAELLEAAQWVELGADIERAKHKDDWDDPPAM